MRSRLLLAGAAALMIAAALFFWKHPAVPEELPAVKAGSDVSQSQSMEVQPETSNTTWIVGIWQGYVAVFRENADLPETVLDMPASALPEPDRSALEQGIPVSDVQALAALLEDYGS